MISGIKNRLTISLYHFVRFFLSRLKVLFTSERICYFVHSNKFLLIR